MFIKPSVHQGLTAGCPAGLDVLQGRFEFRIGAGARHARPREHLPDLSRDPPGPPPPTQRWEARPCPQNAGNAWRTAQSRWNRPAPDFPVLLGRHRENGWNGAA